MGPMTKVMQWDKQEGVEGVQKRGKRSCVREESRWRERSGLPRGISGYSAGHILAAWVHADLCQKSKLVQVIFDSSVLQRLLLGKGTYTSISLHRGDQQLIKVNQC